MKTTIVILATLDTKGAEARYLKGEIEALGSKALLLDMGVVGEPAGFPDILREDVAEAGGTPLSELLKNPTRQKASPVMVEGATALLTKKLSENEIHGVIGMGGTQGTSNCSKVMQALPYGFPKIMVSTVASGDTAPFVGIKDITMMFSVGDLLGLNPLTRKILANAAASAHGMAESRVTLETRDEGKPVIGMTNLGVLTDGAMTALDLFKKAGYEVIVFHAVGSGGRAMEQLMKDGIIGAVFDYALGEISDEIYGGLRAGGSERLTVAGQLGIPQVLCPGGVEHIGVMVDKPDTVPPQYMEHLSVFHNPIILAPRLQPDQMRRVAKEIASRLSHTEKRAVFFMPKAGTSRYGIEEGPLYDPEGDAAFLEELKTKLPRSIELVERDLGAEDPAFVSEAVERLVSLIEEETPATTSV